MQVYTGKLQESRWNRILCSLYYCLPDGAKLQLQNIILIFLCHVQAWRWPKFWPKHVAI